MDLQPGIMSSKENQLIRVLLVLLSTLITGHADVFLCWSLLKKEDVFVMEIVWNLESGDQGSK